MGPYALALTGGPALVYAIVGLASIISGGITLARKRFGGR